MDRQIFWKMYISLSRRKNFGVNPYLFSPLLRRESVHYTMFDFNLTLPEEKLKENVFLNCPCADL